MVDQVPTAFQIASLVSKVVNEHPNLESRVKRELIGRSTLARLTQELFRIAEESSISARAITTRAIGIFSDYPHARAAPRVYFLVEGEQGSVCVVRVIIYRHNPNSVVRVASPLRRSE